MTNTGKKIIYIIVSIGLIALLALIVWGTWSRSSRQITVGAVLPLSGDGAKYGVSARKGIELVISKANREGGIKGRKIVVVYEDSKGLPKDGVTALHKLITVNHVPAVIGGLFSSVTLAMAPVAETNHVVVLSPTSSAPSITHAGDYIFRNCASDVFEGKVMADAAYKRLGIRDVAIVYINNDYGVGIVDTFEKAFTALGGKILAEEAFSQGAVDFRAQLTKTAALHPDGVYIVGYKELGNLLKQAYEMGLKTQFMSTVMFEDPDILAVAGKAADGVIYSARAYDPNGNNPVVRKFVADFNKRYGGIPDIFAAYAYDAARILVHAMKEGDTTADEIKRALYAIHDFPGVTGTTTFDKNGDVTQPAYLKTVKDGHFKWYKAPKTGA